jgi:hypothetical protein
MGVAGLHFPKLLTVPALPIFGYPITPILAVPGMAGKPAR